MRRSLQRGRASRARLRSLAGTLLTVVLLAVALPPSTAQSAAAPMRLDWGSKAPMPTERQELGVAAGANGKLYAVGGDAPTGFCPPDGICGAVEEYDPSTNTWTTRASLHQPRSTLALAATPNGKVYAVGGQVAGSGCTLGTICGTVEEYDLATNTWTTRADLTAPRYSLGLAATPNGKLYAVGGQSDPSVCPPSGQCATVEEYDPATNTWTSRAPLAAPRHNLGLTVAPNGKLYAVGGTSGSGAIPTVEEYDPATNHWTTREGLAVPREALGLAAAPSGKLYAVGGLSSSAMCPPLARCTTVEMYDPSTGHWSLGASLPSPRLLFRLATAPNGRLYAVGGQNGTGNIVPTVDEYDPLGNAWAAPPNLTGLSAPRYLVPGAAVNGRVYVFGGTDASSAPTTTVYEYTPSTNSWRTVAPMPTARWGAAAVVAPDNTVYVVGGNNGSGGVTAVEQFTPPIDSVGQGSWRGPPNPPFDLGLAPLSVGRSEPGVALAANGKLYAAGGSNGGALQSVEEYDPATNGAWRTVATMTTARYGLGLARGGDNRLYAVGGRTDASNAVTTVEAFTPPANSVALGSWTSSVAQLPAARYEPGLIAAPNGNLFAIGGTDGSSSRAETFEYDPSTNAWNTQNNQPTRPPMATPRRAFALVLLGESLFAVGGTNANGVQTSVERAVLTQLPGVSAGGPYTVATGGTIPRHGSGADPEGSGLTFAWDEHGSLLYETAGQNPSFSAAGLPPGTYTVHVRAADALGAYGLASGQVNVVAPTCNPQRPNVRLTTTRGAPGQLQATLSAQANALLPTNSLASVRITSIANAAVTVGGTPASVGQTVTLPSGTTQTTLLLDRHAPPQSSSQASTVAFAVTDSCGEWRSFVGGGPSAF